MTFHSLDHHNFREILSNIANEDNVVRNASTNELIYTQIQRADSPRKVQQLLVSAVRNGDHRLLYYALKNLSLDRDQLSSDLILESPMVSEDDDLVMSYLINYYDQQWMTIPTEEIMRKAIYKEVMRFMISSYTMFGNMKLLQ
jgi:hypothetical protein